MKRMMINFTFYSALLLCFSISFGQAQDAVEGGRLQPIETQLEIPSTLKATFRSVMPKAPRSEENNRGSCPQYQVSNTDSDFGTGQYIFISFCRFVIQT